MLVSAWVSFTLYLPVVSPVLGTAVCPVSLLVIEILEELWIFPSVSFLLVRTEGQLPSSLHAVVETGSPPLLNFKVFLLLWLKRVCFSVTHDLSLATVQIVDIFRYFPCVKIPRRIAICN